MGMYLGEKQKCAPVVHALFRTSLIYLGNVLGQYHEAVTADGNFETQITIKQRVIRTIEALAQCVPVNTINLKMFQLCVD